MTQSRASQVSLDDTPYYHCICRCVRRAFLCGIDHYSGHDYEHRRQWVVDRLAVLADVFAIDLCAYAVMSNHYHLVLRIDRDSALSWSDDEVVARWTRIFSGHLLVDRWRSDAADSAEARRAQEMIDLWRQRLFDLGWFMKCLNEHLARKANEEDQCKGRFWEGRYRSQALLDEKALLSCMAYVDLNPVRAGMADKPEDAEYTSIQQRSQALMSVNAMGEPSLPRLLPLVDAEQIETPDNGTVCRVRLLDYLQLVDATGRAVRAGKGGAISAQAADILKRLNIDERAWLRHMAPRRQRIPLAMGSLARLKAFAASTGRCWVAGQSLASGLG